MRQTHIKQQTFSSLWCPPTVVCKKLLSFRQRQRRVPIAAYTNNDQRMYSVTEVTIHFRLAVGRNSDWNVVRVTECRVLGYLVQRCDIQGLFTAYQLNRPAINVMSMWRLTWHFTNKSVAGAPYSNLSHSRTLWWRVSYDDWNMQCRLEVAAELQQLTQ